MKAEILVGPERRRRWRTEEKLRIVAELAAPGTQVAEIARRHGIARWLGLTHFLEDGRVEIDSNAVEHAIRSLALNRKNALFAGSNGGGEHWAILASLIETCKLNAIDPQAYLADVFDRLVADHPINRLDELLP
jgi:transposase